MDNSVFTHTEFIKSRRFTNDKVVVPAHSHYFFEITYVLDGCFYADIDSKHYELGPNTMFLAPPNTLHSHDSNDGYEVTYMGFYYNGLYGPLNQHIFEDKTGSILNILNFMLDEYKNTNTNYENICLELQKIFVLNLIRMQENNTVLSDNGAILKYAISYLQEHYYEDIDMQQLAKSLGYSYDHFRHIFKENFSMPPKQFLLNQRMQYALRHLRNSNESVSNIAKSCGFASTARFISNFTAMFDMSPMQYRNTNSVNIEVVNFADKAIKDKPVSDLIANKE